MLLIEHVLKKPGAGLDLVQGGCLPRGPLQPLFLFLHHTLDQLIGLLQIFWIPTPKKCVRKAANRCVFH
jgi:hypothetical protein